MTSACAPPERQITPLNIARAKRPGTRKRRRRVVSQMYFEDRHLDTVDFSRDAYRDDLSLEGGRWCGGGALRAAARRRSDLNR